MEYPNLHHQQHHQLHEDYGGQVQHTFSTILSTSHDLNPAIPLNNTTNNMYQTKYNIPNLSEFRSNYPDFGGTDTTSNNSQQSSNPLFNENGINGENIPDSALHRLKQQICSPSDIDKSYFLCSSKYKQDVSSDSSANIWLNNLSTPLMSRDNLYCGDRNGGMASSVDMSHVFPTTGSVPTWGVSPQLFSSSLGFNLPTLDLLTSTNYGGISGHSSHEKHQQYLRDCISSKVEHMQASTNSELNNGSSTRKRTINISLPKEPHAETKKQRTPCPPAKVRERIAALQRLVAPFGKTDQATVLTEAIGYIQFLQDQIQTLSVPYMNSSHGNPSKIMGQGLSNKDRRDSTQRDLKSRGLCLVPLPFASYINNYD